MSEPKGRELIYSQQPTGFIEGRAYSNPRFFTSPRQGVTRVFLVGDWPNIQAAYEALGVPVERLDASQVVSEAGPGPSTAKPPPDLAAKIAEAFPAVTGTAETVAEPVTNTSALTYQATPDPFDHDGDGKPGGSRKGSQSTRAKGARRKRAT